jgi:CxxC-x17-CxxC domain-containing protein
MIYKDYRKSVYPKIKDPVVKSFWINEFDKWEDRFRKEAVAAIQNKVGQFLSSFVIRHIVGQPKSTIDMRDIMDNKKILIVNLSKGKIGEDAMRLLGGMIVTKIQLAAMGRVEIPEEERKDFFLYVDEFQNFATESFANILSEARKYRLALILAHQYVNQLIFDGNTTVRDAIFGNVGTIVSFRVGAEDAEALEKEFEPVFMMNDIVNLSKYQMYLKLMIDGIAGDAFSATSLPPINISETAGNEAKVISVSRERYGKPRAEVEEKIARWSGMFNFEEFEKESLGTKNGPSVSREKIVDNSKSKIKKPILKSKSAERVDNVAKEKTLVEGVAPRVAPRLELKKPASDVSQSKVAEEKIIYDAVCDSCEEKIQVPFKPDPARPTFCKECLKDYQRARAASQKERQEKQVYISQREIMKNNYKKQEKKEEPEPVTIASTDKPISLSQMSHIAPKKFKSTRKKPAVDLGEIRELIEKTKKNNE